MPSILQLYRRQTSRTVIYKSPLAREKGMVTFMPRATPKAWSGKITNLKQLVNYASLHSIFLYKPSLSLAGADVTKDGEGFLVEDDWRRDTSAIIISAKLILYSMNTSRVGKLSFNELIFCSLGGRVPNYEVFVADATYKQLY